MAVYLITGGAGFIGAALATKISENKNDSVVVADNLSTGKIENLPNPLPSNIVLEQENINDPASCALLFAKYSFDFVFHYAAVVGVARTLANPLLVIDDLEGIKNVLKHSANSGVKRLFYASSSEVYGEPFEIPQHEDTTPLNSRLPYAIVKNLGEALLKAYHKEFGLSYTILRFFNTFGPNQSEDFVVAKFLASARAQTQLSIYGDGSQTRTFCFIEDNVDFTLKILEKNLYENDVVNVGSEKEITVLALAKKIIAMTKSTSQIAFLPPLKEGDMTRRKPDNSRMHEVLQRPLISLESGLSKILETTNQAVNVRD